MRPKNLDKAFQDAARSYENGDYPKAARLIKRVRTAVPNEPAVLHLYGLIALRSGKAKPAIESLEKVVALDPSLDRVNALASAYASQGTHNKAIDLLQRALNSAPDHTDTHYNLANFLKEAGDAERSVSHYESAIRLEPDFVDARYNLGNAFSELGRHEDAAGAFHACLRLSPRDADVMKNLGNALFRADNAKAAIEFLSKSIEANPEDDDAHYNLGNALKAAQDFDGALSAFDRALSSNGEEHQYLNNKALILKDLGELDEAISLLENVCAREPRSAVSYSNLIFCKHNSARFSAHELKQESSNWYRILANGLVPLGDEFSSESRAGKKLKVGYISGDLRQHPVGYFFESQFENHDKNAFEIHVFATTRKVDHITERIQANVDHWHDVGALKEGDLARFIRGQGIDILVELSGHAENNRLLTLCYHPSPVQLLGGGLFSTSGLECVDGLITDKWESPEGSEPFYSETLIRMPNDYICYRPPDYAPEVVPSPCLESGTITFGCFNNLAKITPEVVALWAKILNAVPQSRMLLKTTALKSERATARYKDLFSEHGVGDERLILEGGLPHEQFLGEYARVDIALDPFPYSGGLTTLEALWMGVPVVTLAGETFAGRHSTTHLNNAGLAELVTETPDAYVLKASALAQDHRALNDMRQKIRGKLSASPICDGAGYTRDIEGVYLRLWKKWCDGKTH